MINAPRIAIIGGTGLSTLTGMDMLDSEWPSTPFGEPNAPMIHTLLGGELVIFFARHGEGGTGTLSKITGHGGVKADSHVAIPVDERSFEQIEKGDLQPFKALSSLYDAVMPAHVIYSSVDTQPAGFSSHWLQTLLRQEMAFDGVIFSDDLSMEGASVAGNFAERADAALGAGCDLVLVCNNRAAALEVLEHLVHQAVSPSHRLTRLTGTGTMNRNDLRASQRWQETVAALETFMVASA